VIKAWRELGKSLSVHRLRERKLEAWKAKNRVFRQTRVGEKTFRLRKKGGYSIQDLCFLETAAKTS
jgi:hypothetical protein